MSLDNIIISCGTFKVYSKGIIIKDYFIDTDEKMAFYPKEEEITIGRKNCYKDINYDQTSKSLILPDDPMFRTISRKHSNLYLKNSDKDKVSLTYRHLGSSSTSIIYEPAKNNIENLNIKDQEYFHELSKNSDNLYIFLATIETPKRLKDLKHHSGIYVQISLDT